MKMKTTERFAKDAGLVVFGDGDIISIVGEELTIEVVDNGYLIRASESVNLDSKRRQYVFTSDDELLQAVRFWATKQRKGQ